MTSAPTEPENRRARIVAAIEAETGINERMIERLVHRFYDKVRADTVLGPIFDARIADWQPHLARMCAFWSSVVLISGRYHGRPMEAHRELPVDHSHFERWLALFRETARAECPSKAADLFIDRAERIAESLELGIDVFRGNLPPQWQGGPTETSTDQGA